MAEQVAPALRAYHELEGESLLCPEEDDWPEMFAALGDAAKQGIIRERNPKGRHCELLEVSALACSGCKNNPKESSERAQKKQLAETWMSWIMAAFELHDRHRLGTLDVAGLHAAEMSLLLLAWAYRDQVCETRQARLIAVELAKILGRLIR